jgi:hypothetical protein
VSCLLVLLCLSFHASNFVYLSGENKTEHSGLQLQSYIYTWSWYHVDVSSKRY